MKKNNFDVCCGDIVKGFTLAEVLITLAIIGVVAAMTLPSLINNINDAQYKTAWKTNYSSLAQATASIMNDNGGTLVDAFVTDDNNIRDIYKTEMLQAKSCDEGAASGICWPTKGTYLDGNPIGIVNQPALILANGALVRFNLSDSNCDHPQGSSGINSCASVVVDVNGFNNPNTVGIDVFGAWITSSGLKPFGSDGDAGSYASTSTRGWWYSAKYLKE